MFGNEVTIELQRHEVYRSDIAGWRIERAPDPLAQGPVTAAPDWVLEVLSPSTMAHDLGHKQRIYQHDSLVDLAEKHAAAAAVATAVAGGLSDVPAGGPSEFLMAWGQLWPSIPRAWQPDPPCPTWLCTGSPSGSFLSW